MKAIVSKKIGRTDRRTKLTVKGRIKINSTSLVQVTFGVGLPEALHWRLTTEPARTTILPSLGTARMLGATEIHHYIIHVDTGCPIMVEWSIIH